LPYQVVLNFDAPRTLETYLHRIGRTARAGESGVAVSLISDEDRALVKEVVKKGRVTLKQRAVPPQVRNRGFCPVVLWLSLLDVQALLQLPSACWLYGCVPVRVAWL
jgi:superfamily II DNA/RNA helicase